MTEREFLEDKYKLHLYYINKNEIWTLEQLKKYIHIDYNTIQKFVSEGLLYKFNINKVTFYGLKNKYYSNQQIIKSMMMIESNFHVRYDLLPKFKRYSTLEDKSLLSRNVRMIGHSGICDYYDLYYLQKCNTQKDYDRIIQTLIDIQNNNSDSDYICCLIFVRDCDTEELQEYLDNSDKLICYRMSKFINYKIYNVSYPHFKYLKL